MRIVKVKGRTDLTLPCFGNMVGCSVVVTILPEQIWEAKKRNGYWWLTHKGRGYKLRLTEKAMSDHFVDCDVQNE